MQEKKQLRRARVATYEKVRRESKPFWMLRRMY